MENRQAGPGGSSHPVVVVGGGVIGVCCARSLARRGIAVTVVERGEIGHGASFGNAGTVSPAHPPINGPGRWRELIRSVVDPLSPLYIAPRLDPGLLRWLLTFARYGSRSHLDYCRGVMAPLARVTPALHDEIAEAAGVAGFESELGYRADGYLEIFRTAHGERTADEEAAFAAGQSLEPRRVGTEELRAREPGLSHDVQGGFHYANGRSMDPYAFVRAVAADARARGARFETGLEVLAVEVEGGRAHGVRTPDGSLEASAVILATGAYSPGLYAALGCPLPVVPAKGYHVDRPTAQPETPALNLPCLLVETSVFCTPLPGRLRLAGTLEFSGINHDIRPARLRQLTAGARPFLPGLAEAPASSEWCGLRPCTPDGLPVVGALPGWSGIYAATGHAMLGLTFGPITGELLADLVLGETPSIAIEAFAPARFRA